jgi:uncharacterized membrane protein YagU involved in acid resistance
MRYSILLKAKYEEEYMKRLMNGFIAGTLATLPMSVFMWLLNKVLVSRRDREMPPYKITMKVVDKLGFWHKLFKKEEKSTLTAIAHFVYGGLAGVVYGLMAPVLWLPRLLAGVGYGILFWAINYFGALPALRLYPNGLKDNPNRQLTLVVSHLIWGAALGTVFNLLNPQLEWLKTGRAYRALRPMSEGQW